MGAQCAASGIGFYARRVRAVSISRCQSCPHIGIGFTCTKEHKSRREWEMSDKMDETRAEFTACCDRVYVYASPAIHRVSARVRRVVVRSFAPVKIFDFPMEHTYRTRDVRVRCTDIVFFVVSIKQYRYMCVCVCV